MINITLTAQILTAKNGYDKITIGDIMSNMYLTICDKLKNGCDAVLLSVIKSRGSVPRKRGAKMVCFSDNESVGTVGGGAVEHDAMQKCTELTSQSVCLNKKYTLNHADAEKLGMVCGGEVDINFVYVKSCEQNIALFEHISSLVRNHKKAWLVTDVNTGELFVFCDNEWFESRKPDAELYDIFKNVAELSSNEKYYAEPLYQEGVVYVFGGGHVSRALCPMLSATDFRVVVYEDNERFACADDFPDAEKVVCAEFTKINDNISITESDYAVVLTRGHKSDNEVIRQILSKHPTYLGVIGSRKKVGAMGDYLRNCGFDEEDIKAIHSPIGLDIGAVTPSEIAVSITAQLISHRAGKGYV